MKKSTVKKALEHLANAPKVAFYKALETAETPEERAELERLGSALGLVKGVKNEKKRD